MSILNVVETGKRLTDNPALETTCNDSVWEAVPNVQSSLGILSLEAVSPCK